jgi:L-ribulose-5-phosphate 3-epimerase
MNAPQNIPSSSRRQFLSQLAMAGATLPLAQLAGAAEPKKGKKAKQEGAPAPAARASGGPGVMHVFAKPLQIFSYADTAALVAEAGFGGIDYAVRPAGHVVPEKVGDDLPRAVEAAQKAGLKVEMITTAITDARDKFTEPLLRTAVKLGVKIYRFGNFQYDAKLPVMESLQKHKAAVKELESLNRSLGIHGCFQNHAGVRVGGPIWDLYELIKDADAQWIGVQYDIRHATAEGGQSWPLALKLVAPWIKCTDLKDFQWQQSPGKAAIENVPIGEGIVNFDAYFKLVRELNIGGPRSVHFEYPPFERAPQVPENQKRGLFLAAMKKDLAALKGFMAKHQIA